MKSVSSFRPSLLGRLHTWHASPSSRANLAVLPLDEKVKFEPRPVSNWRGRGVTSSPGLRALAVTLLSLWLAFQIGRLQFYRNPATVFFDESRAAEYRYSSVREREARSFMQAAEQEAVDAGRAGEHPRLCASFMTVKRHDVEEQFLSNAVGSLLEGLNMAERSELHVKALFAHVEPAVQPDWTQPWLRDLLDDVYTYDGVVSKRDMDLLADISAQGTPDQKAPIDYSVALQRCFDTTEAPYIAVLEDDILLAHGWFARTMHGLAEIEQMSKVNTERPAWLFMRLFNQERGQEPVIPCFIGSAEILVTLGVSALALVSLLLYRRRSSLSRAQIDNWFIAVICLITIPGFVFLTFQAVVASVPPPMASAPHVVKEPFLGNSQGLIFPRSEVPGIVKYLRQRESGNYDLIIEDYARSHQMPGFSLQPAQIQHVGSHASAVEFHGKNKPLFSAAFEDHDAQRLEDEHAEMVAMQYGSAASNEEMEADSIYAR